MFNWKTILIAIVSIILIVGIVFAYKEYKFLKAKADITEQQETLNSQLQQANIEHSKNEDQLRKQLADKERLLSLLEKRYSDLEKKLSNIVVPTNPNDLVNAFRAKGFKSATIVRRNAVNKP